MKSSPDSTVQSEPSQSPRPNTLPTVTPYLVCAGASDAIAFYTRAFGATEMLRVPMPDGRVMHATIKIGDSMIMLNDEFPEMGALGPKARNGTSVTLHLNVENVDASFARAVDAGATVKMPLENMFWGDRYGLLEDPFGHSWSMATHIRDVSLEELQEAAKAACAAQ